MAPSAAPVNDLAVDLAESRRFLTLLAEGEPVTIQWFPEAPNAKGKAGWAHGDFEELAPRLLKLNQDGHGIFLMVNRGDGRGRAAKNVSVVRALVLDLDGAPLEPVLKVSLPPQIVIETSPGRFHCYWQTDNCALNQFGPMQDALARRFAGDRSVKDLPRVMRLPGFIHRKGSPFRSRVVQSEQCLPYSIFETVEELQLKIDAPGGPTPHDRQAGKGVTSTAPNRAILTLPEGQRNAVLAHLAGAMRRKGMSAMAIEAALLADNVERCLPPLPENEVRSIAASVSRYAPNEKAANVIPWPAAVDKSKGSGGPPPADREHPQITWREGDLDKVVDEAENALRTLPEWPVIFQRGGALVRPIRRGAVNSRHLSTAAGGLAIIGADLPFLVETFTRAASFVKSDRRTDGWKVMNCPDIVARTYLSRAGFWKAPPPLIGVIEAPTLRADGSLLDGPGYDVETGLFFDAGDTVFPTISSRPGRSQAIDALAQLADIFSEFCFVSEVDRCVAIAAALTSLVRTAFSSMPLIAISAPTYGTGKSLLADCISLLSTGRRASTCTAPKDATEFSKMLFAILCEGQPIIVFDNVENTLQDDALASALTSETVTGRVLGATRTVQVSTNVLVIATGNNLQLAGDLSARSLICRLDPKTDRPESRRFSRDLTEWIPQHRGALVCAALTFLRGFQLAKDKPDIEPWGRFPAWSDMVRRALAWGEYPDPLGALRDAEGEDPRRQEHGAMMLSWHAACGSTWVTVRSITSKANDEAVLQRFGLRDALLAIAGERDEINARKLGRWLAKHAGRIQGRLCIEKGGLCEGTMTWRVNPVG